MSATLNDRLIYIREVIRIGIDAAICSYADDDSNDQVIEELEHIASTVDTELVHLGLLRPCCDAFIKQVTGVNYIRLIPQSEYSTGVPVYTVRDDGVYVLNTPAGKHSSAVLGGDA